MLTVNRVMSSKVDPETGDLLIEFADSADEQHVVRFSAAMLPTLMANVLLHGGRAREQAPSTSQVSETIQPLLPIGAKGFRTPEGLPGLSWQFPGGARIAMAFPQGVVPEIQEQVEWLAATGTQTNPS